MKSAGAVIDRQENLQPPGPGTAQGCLFLCDIDNVKHLSESVLMLLTLCIEDGQQCTETEPVYRHTL